MLGCEPYISGNVGSGTVEELAKWVEYMTSEGDSPMARLRRQNGRDKAWKVNTSAWVTKAGVAVEACVPNIMPTSTAAIPPTAATMTAIAFQDSQRCQRLRL